MSLDELPRVHLNPPSSTRGMCFAGGSRFDHEENFASGRQFHSREDPLAREGQPAPTPLAAHVAAPPSTATVVGNAARGNPSAPVTAPTPSAPATSAPNASSAPAHVASPISASAVDAATTPSAALCATGPPSRPAAKTVTVVANGEARAATCASASGTEQQRLAVPPLLGAMKQAKSFVWKNGQLLSNRDNDGTAVAADDPKARLLQKEVEA